MQAIYEKFDEEKVNKFKKVIDELKNVDGSLIAVMNEAQEIFGYLPIEVQQFISEEMNVPLTEIFGIATFYSRFTLKPSGKYKIGLCLGTACYVKGSAMVLDKLKEKLGISVGDVTSDGKFSLEATRCLGACGLAPVMMINGEVFGRLTPDDVDDILKKFD
ncbi:complex I 24 kDa subunit family protein [Thermoanaerobacterium thermosaccharolyticum]|jgi:NADH:ubiquinone oxidoreductase subunit E|uniref:NADH dehydrogenase (Ubiquinone) 24 kDa subunit n=3 Tax=Thermoanaerobacterium thermosaccharolyticum TaxID=1517 RepID=D9TNN0_THETC|nr:NAD(P)H-dependent oxidoreductase subunit E [Thermoanaerobacterium thermosaccharolyticum]TCW41946.1 NAD(P)-dependent iron-only hydrogenase diaphorase component iron-sulfur protein [Thermohydrogenium kirishiense]ADL68636.1 NADH dehydrogenase (ubiquinone) 24 kDa subunit [Thermoanaerobacterium thermosaccharolyticum DSM 571]AGB18720.1 NADH:ubiquinone oxidoreductase 24 kD subunit [Thermoanaerobacterium thermosaccharolyticum M0795]AST56392.1 NADH dehydrogenase (Ubiquinone) 24 kDa subunit [Thermoana